jgi:tetratricopeptide (TPR) repeat protein
MVCLGVAVLGLAGTVFGEKVEWAGKDVKGIEIKVPAAAKPTVVLFLAAGQNQSEQVVALVKAAIGAAAEVQVVAVVSGTEAEAAAKKLAEGGQIAWPVVADGEYAASGKMNVHVWPTTVVVRADGEQVAHLAGISKAYAKDLESYLAFAAGKIDAEGLKQRLEAHDTVVDSAGQMADRHLRVAQRLLEKGLTEQAKVELAAGLKLQPQHAALQQAMVDVLLSLKEADAAIALLDQIDPKNVSGPKLKLLKGKALVGLGKWDEAREVLIGAAALNPNPSEVYYELGLVYQHQQEWQKAAEVFRRAFETSQTGRKVTTQEAVRPATTQP